MSNNQLDEMTMPEQEQNQEQAADLMGTQADCRQMPPRNTQAERTPKQEKRLAQKQEPVRRVGTFTLGVALVLTGLLIAASFVVPGFDFIAAAKLAPLMLVALGLEVLWANARKGQARLKYDFLSGFVCLVLIGGSMAVAIIPAMWKNYGPERAAQNAKLEQQLEQKLFEQIPEGVVDRCELWLETNGIQDPTLADMKRLQYARADIDLIGPFETAEEFAQACGEVLPILRESGLKNIFFTSQEKDKRWEMAVNGLFQLNASPEQLLSHVDCYLKYTEDGEDSWLTQDEIERRKEMQHNEEAQKQAIDQAMYEGYTFGFTDGFAEEPEQKSMEELMEMVGRG